MGVEPNSAQVGSLATQPVCLDAYLVPQLGLEPRKARFLRPLGVPISTSHRGKSGQCGRFRTCDLMLPKHAFCHLNYTLKPVFPRCQPLIELWPARITLTALMPSRVQW